MPSEGKFKTAILRFIMGGKLPVQPVDEGAVLEQARDFLSQNKNYEINREKLRGLSVTNGHDFAAAVFFLGTLANRANRELYDACAANSSLCENASTNVASAQRKLVGLLVPAALYKQYPEFAADGAPLRETLKRLGIETKLADVPSLGTVNEAADVIVAELEAAARKSILLVTLSRGAADVRMALAKKPELVDKIAAWVSVGGLYRGTFLFDRFAKFRGVKKLLVALNCWLHGGSLAFAAPLAAAGSPLSELPETTEWPMPVISVTGVPLRSHLTPFARARSKALDSHGPHDGTVLLTDMVIPGSRVLPVWGADHHFLNPGFSLTFEALVKILLRDL